MKCEIENSETQKSFASVVSSRAHTVRHHIFSARLGHGAQRKRTGKFKVWDLQHRRYTLVWKPDSEPENEFSSHKEDPEKEPSMHPFGFKYLFQCLCLHLRLIRPGV